MADKLAQNLTDNSGPLRDIQTNTTVPSTSAAAWPEPVLDAALREDAARDLAALLEPRRDESPPLTPSWRDPSCRDPSARDPPARDPSRCDCDPSRCDCEPSRADMTSSAGVASPAPLAGLLAVWRE